MDRGEYIVNRVENEEVGMCHVTWPKMKANERIFEANHKKIKSDAYSMEVFGLICQNIVLLVDNETILEKAAVKIEQETDIRIKEPLRVISQELKKENEGYRIVYLDIVTQIKNVFHAK